MQNYTPKLVWNISVRITSLSVGIEIARNEGHEMHVMACKYLQKKSFDMYEWLLTCAQERNTYATEMYQERSRLTWMLIDMHTTSIERKRK